jgi:hypothetical protein
MASVKFAEAKIRLTSKTITFKEIILKNLSISNEEKTRLHNKRSKILRTRESLLTLLIQGTALHTPAFQH